MLKIDIIIKSELRVRDKYMKKTIYAVVALISMSRPCILGWRKGYIKPLIFSVVLLLGAAGISLGQELTGAARGAITGTLVGVMNQAVDAVNDSVAAARAQASVKEAFARQRAAGRPAKADAAALEASLRLEMRANTGRLRFGSRWRQYPDDAAFRDRAYLTGVALEKHVAGLGPVRTWTCSYDKAASLIMSGAIGSLITSANARLYAQPPVPPYTEAERGYRFGPTPPVIEVEPAKDLDSAGWVDWAAAHAAQGAADKMRSARASAELPNSTVTVLSPDRAQVREVIRLWRLAAALENGGPAPRVLPAAKLNAAADKVVEAVSEKYGGAPLNELQACGFEDYVSGQAGRAAKRLLARPKAGAVPGKR